MVGEAAAEFNYIEHDPEMFGGSLASANFLTRVDSKGVRNDRETRRLGHGLLGSAPVIDHCNLLDARNRAVGRARFWR